MKEVKLKRYTSPFTQIPYEFYIQSPIGLVPKDGGKNTRLIFHLSYPKGKWSSSVNANTPQKYCTVAYPDFSEAIKLCLAQGGERYRPVYISRSDVSAAFRNLGIKKKEWKYLIMKAKSPLDGKWYFFVEKCLSFGASISCRNFQEFSNAIAHIVRYKTKQDLVNYLDDYLFCHLLEAMCNGQMEKFLEICIKIGLPIAPKKTIPAATLMTFLGFLIDTINCRVLIPCEKVARGINMIGHILNICRTKKGC